MRCLERNKVTFYFAESTETQAITNNDGYKTGEYKTVYGKVIEVKGRISAAKGAVEHMPYGAMLDYDKTITLDNFAPDISEMCALWIDSVPEVDTDGYTTDRPDYEIVRKAKSLNHIRYEVKRIR